MARIRSIKPEFFKDEALSELPFEYSRLFPGLWCLADREGRLEDRPRFIHAEIFPYHPKIDIEKMISTLTKLNFLIRYEIKGRKYIQIKNFLKHQRPNSREAKSEIPAPTRACLRVQDQEEGEGKGREGERNGVKDAPTKSDASATPQSFIESLKNNPAYKSIDIDRELSKMDAWLQTPKGRRRQKTKGFILNWLNRIDSPLEVNGKDSTAPPRPKILDEPEPDLGTREENAIKAKELVKNLTQKIAGA